MVGLIQQQADGEDPKPPLEQKDGGVDLKKGGGEVPKPLRGNKNGGG